MRIRKACDPVHLTPDATPLPEAGEVWLSRRGARWRVEMFSGPAMYMRNETTQLGRWFDIEQVWINWTKEKPNV